MLAASFLATGCNNLFSNSGGSSGGTGSLIINASTTPVTKVSFGSYSAMDVTIAGLSSQSVYLVKVNDGTSTVAAANTGYKNPLSSAKAALMKPSVGEAASLSVPASKTGITRIDHRGAQVFNANPPAILRNQFASTPSRSAVSASSSGPSASYSQGVSTKPFWVTDDSKAPYAWYQINAKLEYLGTNCYVWVATGNAAHTNDNNLDDSSTLSNDNQITAAQAVALGTEFDAIYPVETNLLGHEFGANSSESVYKAGGIDGDARISILVYDIGSDYTSAQNGGILGFFWSKDYSSQETFTDSGYTYESNKAEMFYVDAHFTDLAPDTIYSTLIHEFQHMINFNRKGVQQNLYSSDSYNEMLSQVAEETIGTKIGIPPTDLPWDRRMNLFTGAYDLYSLTSWQTGSDSANLSSYAITYAFGSYLVHNYGGAALLAAIESNNAVNINSIVNAVNSVNGTSYTFADIYDRFGESLLFGSDTMLSSVNSFYKATSSNTGGTTYTTPKYKIWDVENYFSYNNVSVPQGVYYDYGNPNGVYIHDNGYYIDMPSYTTGVFSESGWQSQSGSMSFNLVKPADANIKFYLMVR